MIVVGLREFSNFSIQWHCKPGVANDSNFSTLYKIEVRFFAFNFQCFHVEALAILRPGLGAKLL